MYSFRRSFYRVFKLFNRVNFNHQYVFKNVVGTSTTACLMAYSINKTMSDTGGYVTNLSINNSGGKTRGLELLTKGGFNVPRFFSIKPYTSKDEIELEMLNHFGENYKNMLFAVRSSASCEDSKTQSFAGQFHTSLGVTSKKILDEIEKVEKSFDNQTGTIIIQEFILNDENDKSGILFTDGLCGNDLNNKCSIINSNFGLCDSVVKGNACDQFFVLTNNGNIISAISRINKKPPIVFENNEFVEKKSTNKASLTNSEINQLVDVGNKIQKYMGEPQDIEWCFNKGELYILQSRPITRKAVHSIIYYEGANIQESYPGIVLPLSYNVMNTAYANIYYNAFLKMGVSINDEQKKSIFNELLFLCNGKMYYNMNNWNNMRKFLPFQNKTNKDSFENFITSNLRNYNYNLCTNPKDEIKPISKIKYIYRTLYNYVYLQSNIDDY
jgi:Phosphoenolpyruvate synthase/pyruvate phosphate dikinase